MRSFIVYYVMLMVVSATSIFSQGNENPIPNAGFEQWAGTEPLYWQTTNIENVVYPITQSSTSREGDYSMAGEVKNLMSAPILPHALSEEQPYGFPVDKRYSALVGYYRYSPVGGDQFRITVGMTKNGNGVAGGELIITSTQNTWKQFILDINYFDDQVPDHCIIEISIFNTPLTHIGSNFLVDDLQFIGEDLYSSILTFGSTSVVSQNITDAGGKAEGADDFIIPAGKEWVIQAVEVNGSYSDGGVGFQSAIVNFMSNQDNKPGAILYADTTFEDNGPNFLVILDPPAIVGTGQWWLNFYVNMPFGPDSSIFAWGTSSVLKGALFHWRDPQDIFGYDVTEWEPGNVNGIGSPDPDLAFELLGFEQDITGIIELSDNVIPEHLILEQNFPNPFNPSTNIRFSLPEASFVNLKIYNVQGEEVAVLINENMASGNYETEWTAGNLPSGVYFCTISTGKYLTTNKMILLK